MGIKIKGRGKGSRRRKKNNDGDILEVGYGEHCVTTINRHDGSVVIHRFTSLEEAKMQYERNLAADLPLVGVGGVAN